MKALDSIWKISVKIHFGVNICRFTWKNKVVIVSLAIVVSVLGLAACSSEQEPLPASAKFVASTPASQAEIHEPLAETTELGAKLYAASCLSCHGDRKGEGGTGLAPPHNRTGHTWHHPDAQLKERIFNGTIGFGQMPAFKDKLTEEEVNAVLTFINTWWTEEQRADQADISKRYQDALDKQKRGQ